LPPAADTILLDYADSLIIDNSFRHYADDALPDADISIFRCHADADYCCC